MHDRPRGIISLLLKNMRGSGARFRYFIIRQRISTMQIVNFLVALVFSQCLLISCQHANSEFEAGSCHVQMTCDAGKKSETQGRPGKRGMTGAKGDRGFKGAKGDGCECTSGSENEELKQMLLLLKPPQCPQTKYIFPRGGQTTDYIRIKTPIQKITSFTMCSWITPTSSAGTYGALVSYAVSTSRNNALLIYFRKTDQANLEVNLNNAASRISMKILRRTHFCVAIARHLGRAKVYTDGAFRHSLAYSDMSSIEGGGSFLIGQEQDSVVGSFDSNQAFSGTIENFMVWYRVLQDAEISSLMRDGCACPGNYALAPTSEVVQLHGAVTAHPVNQCV